MFAANDPDHTSDIRYTVSGEGANNFFEIDSDGKLTVGPNPLDFQGDLDARRRSD